MKVLISFSLLILCCFCSLVTQGQLSVITTVAGNGIRDTGGNGGLAIAAQISAPAGVCLDNHGNLIFADWDGFDVRKVTPAGIISRIAGNGNNVFGGDGGPANAANLSAPFGVAADSFGNIYIADAGHSRIRKIDANGIITTFAGNGNYGYSSDGGLADTTELSTPFGVAVDSAGNVYIADTYNYRVRKVDVATGIITTVAGNGFLSYNGMSGNGGLATDDSLGVITAITVDRHNNLYIISSGDNVHKVTPNGIITQFAGSGLSGFAGDGDSAIHAKFYVPFGIAVDRYGRVYISDQHNHRIRMVDTNGIINTIVGTGMPGFYGDWGSATLAKIYQPEGIALDDSGNLYISDCDNNRIRKVTFTDTTHVDTTNSVATVKAAGISMYPNPVKDAFTLTTTGANITSIDLYDEQGRKVYGRNFTKTKSAIINTKQLPPGTYLLWVNGRYTQKVVKE